MPIQDLNIGPYIPFSDNEKAEGFEHDSLVSLLNKLQTNIQSVATGETIIPEQDEEKDYLIALSDITSYTDISLIASSYFESTVDGWIGSSANITNTDNPWKIHVETINDGFIVKSLFNNNETFSGSRFTHVIINIKKISGNDDIQRLEYSTNNHSFSSIYSSNPKVFKTNWPINKSRTLLFDMRTPTFGGSDWVNSNISGLKFIFGNNSVFEIDYIAVIGPNPKINLILAEQIEANKLAAETSSAAALLYRNSAEDFSDLTLLLKNETENYLNSANTAATLAINAKNAAQTAQTSAQTILNNTEAAKLAAEAAAIATNEDSIAAELSKIGAEASKLAAETAATAASGSANIAETAKNAAQTILNNTEAAKLAAEAAEVAAELSKNSASNFATIASTASTQASNSVTIAQTILNNTDAAKLAAEAAAIAAANSATAASGSATTATTKANDASTSATAAATSATAAAASQTAAATSASAASTSATTATTKANDASTSATAAATSATAAATSATNAANSATAASTSATTATTKANDASTSATAAATSATAAAASQTAADNSASAASTSATNASTSAGSANTYATQASTSATNAANSANSASTSSGAAATSATNAANSATAASGSATTATTKANDASTSATAASGSATTATTKAGEASISATNAATSATAAANSASAASTSATTATTKANDASTSATAAATSATNAATSATNASTSATVASTSATTATTKANDASTSATAAATSATAAAASQTAAANSATISQTNSLTSETYSILSRYTDAYPDGSTSFNNTLDGWTGSGGTLSLLNPAPGAGFLSSNANNYIQKTGLSFSGSRFTHVIVRVKRISGTDNTDQSLYWITSSHTTFSGSYRNNPINGVKILPIGTEVDLIYDMRTPTVGGTDWTSNTITGLRFDPTSTSSEQINILYIGILGPDTAAPAKAASAAATSASSASTSATNAANSASAASTSATNASTSAGSANTYATQASTSATTATTKANEASTSSGAAATSATNAANSATAASGSANTATTQATNAANSASAASTSATTATTKANDASTSATAAATSATAAATSATNASTSATNAANSASAASTSATTATTKANDASTSATAAATSATAAAASQTAASNSASAASTSATTATTKANGASTSATAAATSATNAATSATNASISAIAAEQNRLRAQLSFSGFTNLGFEDGNIDTFGTPGNWITSVSTNPSRFKWSSVVDSSSLYSSLKSWGALSSIQNGGNVGPFKIGKRIDVSNASSASINFSIKILPQISYTIPSSISLGTDQTFISINDVYLQLRAWDSNGSEITLSNSIKWSKTLSQKLYDSGITGTINTTTWRTFTHSITVPTNATQIQLDLIGVSNSNSITALGYFSGDATVLIDDASITSSANLFEISDSAKASIDSARLAQISATNAANSATAASGSATTATTKANDASTSATAAATSATAAAASQTAAANSASAASTSATTATTQAANAASSATAASTSATNAAGSATAASGSAAVSQTNALTATSYAILSRYTDSQQDTTTAFNGSLNSWTVNNNGTLVLSSPSPGADHTSTNTDPYITRTVVSFSGSRFTHVIVRVKRISGTDNSEQKLYWTTSGHSWSSSYYSLPVGGLQTLPIGTEVDLIYDMRTPTVGGTDWTSNTITGLRLDIFQLTGNSCQILWIGVLGPDTAAPAKAASAAATSAANAATSETAASTSASSASTSATTATTKAGEASTSATNAATSATNAANSANSASTSATNAANSATSAGNSASSASTSASNASTSASNAATSATSASGSANTATTQATNAANSATAASTSASNASSSQTAAATSATAAATSATNASTSATNASTSAGSASTSATNAANSASTASSWSNVSARLTNSTGWHPSPTFNDWTGSFPNNFSSLNDSTSGYNTTTKETTDVLGINALRISSTAQTTNKAGVAIFTNNAAVQGPIDPNYIIAEIDVKFISGDPSHWRTYCFWYDGTVRTAESRFTTIQSRPTAVEINGGNIELGKRYSLRVMFKRPSTVVNTVTYASVRFTRNSSYDSPFASGEVIIYRFQLRSPTEQEIDSFKVRSDISASVTTETTARITSDNDIYAKYAVKVDTNGYVSGFGLISTANNASPTSTFTILADNFLIAKPSVSGGTPQQVFEIGSVNGTNKLVMRGDMFADGVITANALAVGAQPNFLLNSDFGSKWDNINLSSSGGTVTRYIGRDQSGWAGVKFPLDWDCLSEYRTGDTTNYSNWDLKSANGSVDIAIDPTLYYQASFYAFEERVSAVGSAIQALFYNGSTYLGYVQSTLAAHTVYQESTATYVTDSSAVGSMAGCNYSYRAHPTSSTGGSTETSMNRRYIIFKPPTSATKVNIRIVRLATATGQTDSYSYFCRPFFGPAYKNQSSPSPWTLGAVSIRDGQITAPKISVSSLSAITATIGEFKSATTGARLEIKDDRLRVYDSNNVLRVVLGNLA